MLDAKGRGSEYVRFRGSVWDGLILLCVILHAFMFTFIHCVIYVIVRLLWHVCSLLWSLYMSCHLVMLICFASAFYSDANELYFLYSCLFHILWVHCVGLDHISMLNPLLFLLSIAYMNQACWKPHSSLIHTRGCVVINHQKGRDWKHLGPSWVSMINDNTRLLWLTCVL